MAEAQTPSSAAELIAGSRRVTVKVGSSLLIAGTSSEARAAWLASLAADIAELRTQGKQVLVVSSGAVALGRERLGLGRSPRLDVKQAAAALGQPRLMQAWDTALAPHGLSAAQLLLTLGDTEDRRRWLNARATLEVLLGRDMVPVINENDSVATAELRYGDNDRLSARVAQMVRSDLLILLSDIDGLYTADPASVPDAQHVPAIGDVTEAVEAFAGGAAGEGVGTGGMRTKLAAARIARGAGCATIIASGREDAPVARLLAGARATVVEASGSPARAYKQWIAGVLAPAGALIVDDGAARALATGKSLLPAGIKRVEGSFEKGACLSVCTEEGREIARGLSAYGSADAAAIAGRPSSAIAGRLGYRGADEIIHRDDMVLL